MITENQENIFAPAIASKLSDNRNSLKEMWENSSTQEIPTRYFYIDDLLEENDAVEISSSFNVEGSFWNKVSDFRERKSSFQKIDTLSPIITQITDAFHEDHVIEIVSEITGLENLESDPSLYAGGLSLMSKGDFLNPHIDNSHDGGKSKYRRLNLLFYTSKNWRQDFGGSLELWNKSVTKKKQIPAFFNRLVVMETNHLSWHSVNKIATDEPRLCVSNYYFSKRSPLNHEYYHVTSFNGLPSQKFRRVYSKIDNFLRQKYVLLAGSGRGTARGRFKKT